jgi:hypothetical protein
MLQNLRIRGSVASDISAGSIEDVLGLLQQQNSTAPKWVEIDGVIHFTVESEGVTGKAWIQYFEATGVYINNRTRRMLSSDEFSPTEGLVTNIRLFRGEVFVNEERYESILREQVARQHLLIPNLEQACLVHKALTVQILQEMQLGSVIAQYDLVRTSDMKSPEKDSELWQALSDALWRFRSRRFDAFSGKPISRFGLDVGFAFVVL